MNYVIYEYVYFEILPSTGINTTVSLYILWYCWYCIEIHDI